MTTRVAAALVLRRVKARVVTGIRALEDMPRRDARAQGQLEGLRYVASVIRIAEARPVRPVRRRRV